MSTNNPFDIVLADASAAAAQLREKEKADASAAAAAKAELKANLKRQREEERQEVLRKAFFADFQRFVAEQLFPWTRRRNPALKPTPEQMPDTAFVQAVRQYVIAMVQVSPDTVVPSLDFTTRQEIMTVFGGVLRKYQDQDMVLPANTIVGQREYDRVVQEAAKRREAQAKARAASDTPKTGLPPIKIGRPNAFDQKKKVAGTTVMTQVVIRPNATTASKKHNPRANKAKRKAGNQPVAA